MPTPPNATASTPVTAVRLDAPLKARITAAQAELAREMPGLTPTFSDTVRVLINEALAVRAIASPTAASPTAAPAGADAGADALRAYFVDFAAAARVDRAAALAVGPDIAALRAIAARVPASRGAGGITLHRATNGASVATVVANDPK
jgi:hypothetical protein